MIGHHRELKKELQEYIKDKIKMLERDFRIKLTTDEKAHFYNDMKSERDVDRYALDLIMNKF